MGGLVVSACRVAADVGSCNVKMAQAIALALLFFNVGVELGQLTFIAVVLLAAALLSRLLRISAEPIWAVQLQAYVIGGLASYWLIERVSAFWV